MFCLSHVFLAVTGRTEETGERKPEVYTIYDIAVDETARNVAQARIIALTKGQREALTQLLRKILRPEDLDKLPYFDDRQVRDLISGFEILDERNSDVRYIARLRVHFSRNKVFDLLSLLQIPFAETLSAPVTILPVLRKDGAYFLWEDRNEWKKAWEAYEGLNSLVPVVIPPSTFKQQLLITSWQAEAGFPASLEKFARAQEVKDLVVAIAVLNKDIVRDRYDMTLTLRRGLKGEVVFSKHLQAGVDDMALPGAEVALLYEKGIAATMEYLNTVWREKVLVHFGVAASVRFDARFLDMAEWREIHERLMAIPLVRKVKLQRLALNHATLEVDHAGEYEQLMLTLRQKGLLVEEEEGVKVLKLEADHP
ncbi:DUF2066 domain-containing protein [Luteithermobacter gelatinilyticus]|uniref:DUF2066 domain-containing protein n=1 Tax=Luteithermobacter gelatinilyticus TaxID=2582913 RepID=UPI00143D6C0E|nr:DUF2066 domain-containing protein [Luteithermobacter gelatinilyticus]